MNCSHNTHRAGGSSPLIVNDLCAQLAPLNRYGLPGLGAVVANGARALIGVSRKAFFGPALTRSESNELA